MTMEQGKIDQANELYAQGASISAVAKAIGCTWYEAKKLQPGLLHKAKSDPEPELKKSDEPEFWDLTLTVPATQLDNVFATFTASEKAQAVNAVLQGRMDLALEAIG